MIVGNDIKYIDFHCHCDLLPGFDNGSLKLAREVAAIAVTTTPLAWPKNVEESKRITGMIPALGMHPQLIGSRFNDHYSFSKYIQDASIVGEIGLDGSTAFKESLAAQETVLSEILELCAENSKTKVLSIHSLRAETKLIRLLQQKISANSLTPVMHWFTGSVTQASKLLDIGAKFSFNHKMIRTKRGQNLLAHIPKETVLIETDLPFTSKTFDSALHKTLLKETTVKIATHLNVHHEELSDSILQNSTELLATTFK
ncbi:TatD family hydrolase [Vibrio paucivorans]|uniref:TatD family hydrolase n=1 Tax=Vibrio paucivorans TaxID=2829489 RepID=A0A9X3HUB2_9VIBR|nr:TatD family hydrolase [Vibrio paucivorans]MCW8336433.1 TatD family hydrolase [Vibrio paucivorans]